LRLTFPAAFLAVFRRAFFRAAIVPLQIGSGVVCVATLNQFRVRTLLVLMGLRPASSKVRGYDARDDQEEPGQSQDVSVRLFLHLGNPEAEDRLIAGEQQESQREQQQKPLLG